MKLENSLNNICVICDKSLFDPSYWLCLKCNKPCETNIKEQISEDIFDVKSKCCNADVENSVKVTCSDNCHKIYVTQLEEKFGEFKKVVDQETGITYKIPTRDIIERGLKYSDVRTYPVWEN